MLASKLSDPQESTCSDAPLLTSGFGQGCAADADFGRIRPAG
jgi:hypothetical protein